MTSSDDPAGPSSHDSGPRPIPVAPLSSEEMEAHVKTACEAVRSGGKFEVLDLRGHPNAGGAIDAIVDAASGTFSLNCLNLKTLNLEFAMRVMDSHIAELAACGTLVDVNLNATSEIGDWAIHALVAMNKNTLRSVQLYWNVLVTDEYIVKLIENCGKTLQVLNLSGCKRLTDLTAKAIGTHCESLSHLDCTRVAFTDDGISKLCLSPKLSVTLTKLNLYASPLLGHTPFRCITTLSNLTWFDICGAQGLSDEALIEIADGCEKLKYLNLSWCLAVTDVGVTSICKSCKNLELLSVHGNRNVTDAVIDVLYENNAKGALKTLDVRGCMGIDQNRVKLIEKFPSLTEFVHHT